VRYHDILSIPPHELDNAARCTPDSNLHKSDCPSSASATTFYKSRISGTRNSSNCCLVLVGGIAVSLTLNFVFSTPNASSLLHSLQTVVQWRVMMVYSLVAGVVPSLLGCHHIISKVLKALRYWVRMEGKCCWGYALSVGASKPVICTSIDFR
jgi:hypothetical protein